EQARVAGAGVAGVAAAFHGAVPVTRLKVAEIELFCAGAPSAETDDDDEVVSMDTRGGTYTKLVLRGERLLGAILLGDTTLGPRLAELLRTGEPVPAALLDAGGVSADALGDADDDEMLVCACMSVTRGRIVEAVRRDALSDVDAVARATQAGTGCGTCRQTVASLLRDAAAAA
ncbi:MAG: (2Fe-2S)-binding protein, partial [Solirubrobacteraceae bacterium]